MTKQTSKLRDLLIYNETLQMAADLLPALGKMEKTFRFTLGDDMSMRVINTLHKVTVAWQTYGDKTQAIRDLRTEYTLLQNDMELCSKFHLLSRTLINATTKRLGELISQTYKWANKQPRKQSMSDIGQVLDFNDPNVKV